MKYGSEGDIFNSGFRWDETRAGEDAITGPPTARYMLLVRSITALKEEVVSERWNSGCR